MRAPRGAAPGVCSGVHRQTPVRAAARRRTPGPPRALEGVQRGSMPRGGWISCGSVRTHADAARQQSGGMHACPTTRTTRTRTATSSRTRARARGGARDEDGEARPAVFVTTAQPVPHPRRPAGRRARARGHGARRRTSASASIARSAMDAESIDRLLALGLFDEPVPLGLFAYEEEPGLQCRLFALVPLRRAARGGATPTSRGRRACRASRTRSSRRRRGRRGPVDGDDPARPHRALRERSASTPTTSPRRRSTSSRRSSPAARSPTRARRRSTTC